LVPVWSLFGPCLVPVWSLFDQNQTLTRYCVLSCLVLMVQSWRCYPETGWPL